MIMQAEKERLSYALKLTMFYVFSRFASVSEKDEMILFILYFTLMLVEKICNACVFYEFLQGQTMNPEKCSDYCR